MDVQLLTMEVRPRTPWESMDLAVKLVIAHRYLLFTSWLAIVLPLFIIISMVFLQGHPYWAFFLVWWLKPLYDRISLFIFSRALFSEQLDWKKVLTALPDLLKNGLLAALTLYRLDPGRAFKLPVQQLEGLKGQQKRQRVTALKRSVKNREVLFMVLCFHLENIIYWGCIGLFIMMLPEHQAGQLAEDLLTTEDPGLWLNSIFMLLYFFTLLLVENLYVAGGFMLYLNRRVILEGWDLEIAFRKLTQRQAGTISSWNQSRIGQLFAFTLILLCLFFMPQQPVQANNAELPEVSEQALAGEYSKQVINEVMESPVFSQLKEIDTLKYIGNKDSNNTRQQSQPWMTDFFENFGKGFAIAFEFGLWLLAAFALLVIMLKWEYLLIAFKQRKKYRPKSKPGTLFGLDIREESLPEDIATEAMQLYLQGSYRSALALLYRGTLARLVVYYSLDLQRSATEGDCLKQVLQTPAISSRQRNYLSLLTNAWQLTAYAHRIIEKPVMEQLCKEWRQCFELEAGINIKHTIANGHVDE